MKRSLLGFHGLFAEDYGDPATAKPYPCVTPSRVGPVLLPFPCPHCGSVRDEMVDAALRMHYLHPRDGYYFCPSCNKRYELDLAGMPLATALEPGATFAPARVEHPPKDGATDVGALLELAR